MIYALRDDIVRTIEADGLHISLDDVGSLTMVRPKTTLRKCGEIDRSTVYM